MPRTKEELSAQLVWSYVEYLRSGQGEGRFTPADLDELQSLLRTAGEVPEALAQPGLDLAHPEVRGHVAKLVAAGAAHRCPSPPARSRRSLALPTLPMPALGFGAALAAILALGAALATVDLWHAPTPRRQVVRYTERPSDVERMDEQSAHRLIPLMVRNELSAQQEKNLMWHMLECPGCFNRYVALRHPGAGPRQAADWRMTYELARR